MYGQPNIMNLIKLEENFRCLKESELCEFDRKNFSWICKSCDFNFIQEHAIPFETKLAFGFRLCCPKCATVFQIVKVGERAY